MAPGFLFNFTLMKPEYNPEDIVYLKTDPDILPRMVTGYKVTKKDITYELSCGTLVSWHYGFEIQKEKESNKATPGFGK